MVQDSTILLYTYNDILEANIIRNKLKDAGIDSFIENEDVVGLNPGGGIKVKIFSKDQEAAEKIINE
jgi:Putative prokaryotic signal transducing protein